MKKRDPKKLARVLEQKGYSKGKVPKGKVVHHVKPVVEDGKTTSKNIRVIPKGKHKQIHKNRRKLGKI